MKNLNSNNLTKCLGSMDDGILINIAVKPGSKNSGIEGIDKWRECIVIRIKAKAEKGRANKELVQYLSSWLGLPSSNFTIVKGEKDRHKNIKILGLEKEELMKKLKREMDSK